MARPKNKSAAPKKSEREPRGLVFSIRGSTEWRAWLDRLADHNRLTVADAIDHSLILLAKASNFSEPAPKR